MAAFARCMTNRGRLSLAATACHASPHKAAARAASVRRRGRRARSCRSVAGSENPTGMDAARFGVEPARE